MGLKVITDVPERIPLVSEVLCVPPDRVRSHLVYQSMVYYVYNIYGVKDAERCTVYARATHVDHQGYHIPAVNQAFQEVIMEYSYEPVKRGDPMVKTIVGHFNIQTEETDIHGYGAISLAAAALARLAEQPDIKVPEFIFRYTNPILTVSSPYTELSVNDMMELLNALRNILAEAMPKPESIPAEALQLRLGS